MPEINPLDPTGSYRVYIHYAMTLVNDDIIWVTVVREVMGDVQLDILEATIRTALAEGRVVFQTGIRYQVKAVGEGVVVLVSKATGDPTTTVL
jgi:hypothetical protein